MAMELSPNMGAGSKQFGTNCGVFSGHCWIPETLILVQVEPAEYARFVCYCFLLRKLEKFPVCMCYIFY